MTIDFHFIIQDVVPPLFIELQFRYRVEIRYISVGNNGGLEENRKLSHVVIAIASHDHLRNGRAQIFLPGIPSRGVRFVFTYLAVESVLNTAVAGVDHVIELFAGLFLEVHADVASELLIGAEECEFVAAEVLVWVGIFVFYGVLRNTVGVCSHVIFDVAVAAGNRGAAYDES